MIARARGRQTFQRLTREGSRIRRSTLWCTWCPQDTRPQLDSPHVPSAPPGCQVAFSTGRALGPAVTRNRLRRRLRAILAALDAAEPFPPVIMLIGATPAATKLTFDQLRLNLQELILQVRSAASSPAPNG